LDFSIYLILPDAFGSTQPLTEMSIRNVPGGKMRPTRKADNVTAICEPIVKKIWKPRRLTTLWASMACYRDGFAFTTVEAFMTVKIPGEVSYIMALCYSLVDHC
jgi:hypothetical protein